MVGVMLSVKLTCSPLLCSSCQCTWELGAANARWDWGRAPALLTGMKVEPCYLLPNLAAADVVCGYGPRPGSVHRLSALIPPETI